MVMAVAMSSEPFRSFAFDGIFGLGLDGLTLSPEFGFFGRLVESGEAPEPRFGVFLSDEGDEEESEIAFGGYNSDRVDGELHWAPVAMPELGYWQVRITAVWVGDRKLDICNKESDCRGVVDTGTSLVGVPSGFHAEVDAALSAPLPAQLHPEADRGDVDCRKLPQLQPLRVELGGSSGFTIELEASDYMRKNPLGRGKNGTVPLLPSANAAVAASEWQCRPRLMPIGLPAPLGPNLFILGEPVLRKYYSVFDRSGPKIGFARVRRQRRDPVMTAPAGGGLLGARAPTIAARIREARLAREAENQRRNNGNPEMTIVT